jgi:hypothetical protein
MHARRLAPPLLALAIALSSAPAHAEDWCKPATVESQVRRWASAPFAKKKDMTKVADGLREHLAQELLGTLAVQVDTRYQAQVMALTGRVQTLSTTQRKVSGAREVCVVVQMDKGGLLGDLPSDVGRQLLTAWQDRLVEFTAGRPVWVREVALRDRSEPEVDEVVVPRVEDLVRRNLMGVVRYEPDGSPIPADVITFDVRITPFPGYYAIEGVARDAAGRSLSVGAELATAWLGGVGTRLPPSSRDVQIVSFSAPAVVAPGSVATLAWTTQNARTCKVEPGVGDVPTNGKSELLPKGDTSYRLTCTDGVRTVSRDAAVAVRVPSPEVNATAKPARIAPGGGATVSWTSAAVTSCAIDHGVGPVGKSGQIGVTPEQTTTYAVTCAGQDGTTAVSTATVIVDSSLLVQQVVQLVTDPNATLIAPPVATTAPVLDIRVLDGEWMDVRVNGAVVASFKNSTEATVTLEDRPSYFIEVVPFMGDAAVQSVTMSNLYKGHGSIGVSLTEPINCYGTGTCVP